MGQGMKRVEHAALLEYAIVHIAAHLESRHTRNVRFQRERLELEHQPHVLLPRIRNAERGLSTLACDRRSVVALDRFDLAFYGSDAFEEPIQSAGIVRSQAEQGSFNAVQRAAAQA